MAGITDFRLPIAPPWRADGHWKELPRHFSIVNRQSARRGAAMKTWSLVAAMPRCEAVRRNYLGKKYINHPSTRAVPTNAPKTFAA
jgi:hypothetical protein